MKELLKKFENLWVSIAFAEAGEQKTSLEILSPDAHEERVAEICPAV